MRYFKIKKLNMNFSHGIKTIFNQKKSKNETDIYYKILKRVCEDHNCPITRHNEGLFRWF